MRARDARGCASSLIADECDCSHPKRTHYARHSPPCEGAAQRHTKKCTAVGQLLLSSQSTGARAATRSVQAVRGESQSGVHDGAEADVVRDVEWRRQRSDWTRTQYEDVEQLTGTRHFSAAGNGVGTERRESRVALHS